MRSPKPVRRYTASETLQAVARMINAPRPGGICLATVEEVSACSGTRVPRVKLTHLAGLHALRRWADALQDVSKVEVYAALGDPAFVTVTVTGRIPRGPIVEVSISSSRLPLADPWQPGEERRVLTLAELRALDEAHRAGGGR